MTNTSTKDLSIWPVIGGIMHSLGKHKQTLHGEKKNPRNILLTDKAWNSLKHETDLLGVRSVSELIEQRARAFHPLNTPAFRQVKVLLEGRYTLFWSLAAFTRRDATQLGIEYGDNLEEFLVSHITKAVSVLVLISYAIPEIDINCSMPFLRWIINQLLLTESKIEIPKKSNIVLDIDIDKSIQEISAGITLLQRSIAEHYSILYMHYIGGLTRQQIERQYSLNGTKISLLDINEKMQVALHEMRRNIHKHTNILKNKENQGSDFECDDAKDYYNLCLIEKTTSENRNSLRKFLLKSFNDMKLSFWITEIDHWVEHQLTGWDSEHNHPAIRDLYRDVLDEVLVKFDKQIEQQVMDLNENLRFAQTKSDICLAIDNSLKEITGIDTNDSVIHVLDLQSIPALNGYLFKADSITPERH